MRKIAIFGSVSEGGVMSSMVSRDVNQCFLRKLIKFDYKKENKFLQESLSNKLRCYHVFPQSFQQ